MTTILIYFRTSHVQNLWGYFSEVINIETWCTTWISFWHIWGNPVTSWQGDARYCWTWSRYKRKPGQKNCCQFKERNQKSEVKCQICKNYVLPGNCASLAVPKNNPPVLGMKSLADYHKRTQRSLYGTQLTLLKASSAVIEIANHTKRLVKNSLDAITLIGSASNDTAESWTSDRLFHRDSGSCVVLLVPYQNSSRVMICRRKMKEAQKANKLQHL